MNDDTYSYFWWLCDMIGLSKRNRLAMIFHEVPYGWVESMDENSYKNGLYMRTKYELETGKKCTFSSQCTVFEVLVSLIYRLNNAMFDGSHGYSLILWNACAENLGLTVDSTEEEIKRKCYMFMTGQITLFNYIQSDRTSRKDLWYQGNYWIDQNFPY